MLFQSLGNKMAEFEQKIALLENGKSVDGIFSAENRFPAAANVDNDRPTIGGCAQAYILPCAFSSAIGEGRTRANECFVNKQVQADGRLEQRWSEPKPAQSIAIKLISPVKRKRPSAKGAFNIFSSTNREISTTRSRIQAPHLPLSPVISYFTLGIAEEGRSPCNPTHAVLSNKTPSQTAHARAEN